MPVPIRTSPLQASSNKFNVAHQHSVRATPRHHTSSFADSGKASALPAEESFVGPRV